MVFECCKLKISFTLTYSRAPSDFAGSEEMLYDVFQIWAQQKQPKQKSQGQATYLPTFQQLTTVCRLLCERAEYAQALGLAEVRPNMQAQQAAEHASTVFEAARAAQCQLGPITLRIIMARCVLGGTSAFLRCCSQVSVDSLGIVYTMLVIAVACFDFWTQTKVRHRCVAPCLINSDACCPAMCPFNS